jgi:hypothetical protein
MKARIYKPAKTAMQSGRAAIKAWVLDYEPETAKAIEPLMGWTASADMRQQIHLEFDTLEEAVAYAERNDIPYEVEPEPVKREQPAISYSDNFKSGRKDLWTH